MEPIQEKAGRLREYNKEKERGRGEKPGQQYAQRLGSSFM